MLREKSFNRYFRGISFLEESRLREYVTHMQAFFRIIWKSKRDQHERDHRTDSWSSRAHYVPLSQAVNQLALRLDKESEKRDSSGSLSENSRPGW